MTDARLDKLSKPELIVVILRLEQRLVALESEVASLRKRNAELLDHLPGEPRLNVDETGHKENGQPSPLLLPEPAKA